jgi:hypothetical protein
LLERQDWSLPPSRYEWEAGAGSQHSGLHEPGYDFPDELIEIGSAGINRALRDLLN